MLGESDPATQIPAMIRGGGPPKALIRAFREQSGFNYCDRLYIVSAARSARLLLFLTLTVWTNVDHLHK